MDKGFSARTGQEGKEGQLPSMCESSQNAWSPAWVWVRIKSRPDGPRLMG